MPSTSLEQTLEWATEHWFAEELLENLRAITYEFTSDPAKKIYIGRFKRQYARLFGDINYPIPEIFDTIKTGPVETWPSGSANGGFVSDSPILPEERVRALGIAFQEMLREYTITSIRAKSKKL